MKLLVIGGTKFLGRHLVAQALAADHEVTMLNRGRTGPGPTLFPDAQHLVADRNGDLSVLRGTGPWDAVLDTCAYVPRHVQALAAALGPATVGQYQMVSTISVYADPMVAPVHENAPLATLPDPATEVVDGTTYGGLKALCEQAAVAAFGARALLPRPGLIVGPHDPSERFTWWVRRFMQADLRGGEVLAPGHPEAPVQFIDARDLAAWMLKQVGTTTAGPVNLVGPVQALTMGEFLDTARTTLSPAATLTWVDEAFLLEQQVGPWMELPIWLPAADAALHRTALDRALVTGLSTRSLAKTLADTAAWAATVPEDQASRPGVGLAHEREAEVLCLWHAATPGTEA